MSRSYNVVLLYIIIIIIFILFFNIEGGGYLFRHYKQKVALGARLGVLTEAASMAAVLSATSTPFRKASHMVHGDPDEYNGIVGRSFVSTFIH